MTLENTPIHHGDAWHTLARQVRDQLAEFASRHEDEQRAVFDLIRLLDRMEALYRSRTASDREEGPARRPSHGQQIRNRPRAYERITKKGRSYLSESREGGRQPFLVPCEVYDAAVAVMSEARKSTAFADLRQKLEQRLQHEVSDYLLRTCLRFWQSSKCPLVKKSRARYQPVTPATFQQDAKRAWQQLPEND